MREKTKQAQDLLRFKLLIIGESGVGKTSILQRFIDNQFHGAFTSTIGIDFRAKTVSVQGRDVELQIWDTAGQERFFSITKSYYRGADGIFLVFDLADISSFKHIEKWMSVVRTKTEGDVPVILIGNKKDLVPKEEVPEYPTVAELKKHAHRLRSPWYLTSAESGENIEKIFHDIGAIILQRTDKTGPGRDGAFRLPQGSKAPGAHMPRGCC